MRLADFIKDKLQEAPNWMMLPLLHINRFGDRVYGGRMRKFRESIPTIDPERKLVDMANYAIEHVPYYRKLYGGTHIASAEHFRRTFGFIDKDTVRANYHDFISDEADRLPHVALRTSGTSGKPMQFLIPADRYVTEMAFVTRVWKHAGFNFGIKAAVRKKQMPAGRDYMVNPVTREIIFDGNRTDEHYIRLIHRVMKRHHIHTLYCYPSTGMQLLKLFMKYGLDTSFIKYALLTSEAVPADIYRFIHDKLGITIATFYGHTEKLIFIEQLDGTPRFAIEPAYGYTEIIGDDGQPAQEGELVGSTFYNRVMPLLRYRTGDYARLSGGKDQEGRQILDQITGRREQLDIVRHDGTTINTILLEIHDEFPLHIDGHQFVQTRPGHLEVRIIKGDDFTHADEEYMYTHYGHCMLGREYVHIIYVDALECTPSGKAPQLISTIKR